MAIGNAWCVIPVSFNKNKMALNASVCSVRSAMKHHMPPQCIPEVHRIYFSFEVKMKGNTFIQTVQILLKTETITTCDLSSTGLKCKLQLPDIYRVLIINTMIPVPACKYIACLSAD